MRRACHDNPPTVEHMSQARPYDDERLQVIRAGHTGDGATARSGVSADDPAVREAAFGALARLGALTDDDLLLALRDCATRVVRRATELAAAAGSLNDSVDALLLGLVGGDDDALAESAAWSLGERHQSHDDGPTAPPNVCDALTAAATSHHDALVREAATAALGCIANPSTLWAVLAACKDKATVRRRAVLALAAFEGPDVDAALTAAKDDRDWQVRQAAEDLLAE